jgi:hypothetical protein
MPAHITVLTVQAPELLGPNIAELGDNLLMPLVRSLESGSLFEQDNVCVLDPEAETQLVADFGRYASLAKGTEPLGDVRSLNLR